MPGKVRQIAESKNSGLIESGPTASNYDSQGGHPRDAKDISHGEYAHNVGDGQNYASLTKSPTPSKSVKRSIK
jgi:hypothetical protein